MKKPLYLLTALLLVNGCSSETVNHTSSQGSWATGNLINFHHVSYTGTDKTVEKVESKIGTIAQSSKNEQDANDENFSNTYPKGTNLYKIPGVPIKEAIAIEVRKHHYVKAVKWK